MPPPTGSSGAVPDTVPTSGPSESETAVMFHGETYVLPHSISIKMLQSDGFTITSFSDSVASGTATVSIPPSSSQTSLSAGGLSLEAGPEPLHSAASGGAKGLAALIDALEVLGSTTNTIVNTLDQIGE